jgi:hypothetical protein
MELVINLLDDRIPLFARESRSALLCQRQSQIGNTNGSMLCGAHSQGFIINNDSKIGVIGIHFKPGGSAPFFTHPAGELYNQIYSKLGFCPLDEAQLTTGFQQIRLKELAARLPISERVIMYCEFQPLSNSEDL